MSPKRFTNGRLSYISATVKLRESTGRAGGLPGIITGEQEFSEMIYDIWVNSPTEEKLQKGFSQLGARLKRAKTGYESTKALDEKLFGENYEL